jgi:hypothetical protein
MIHRPCEETEKGMTMEERLFEVAPSAGAWSQEMQKIGCCDA